MNGGRWWVVVACGAASCLLGLASISPAAAGTTARNVISPAHVPSPGPITPVTPATPPSLPIDEPFAPLPPPRPDAGASVSIVDYGFSPATITVAAGTTVTWVNTGASIHSVTSNTGAFDSSPSCPNGPCIESGASFSHQFAEAGRFSYHCRVHAQMTGTIVVTAAPATTTTTTTHRAPGTTTPGATTPGNAPVTAGGTPGPAAVSPAATTGPQLAFTGSPAAEAWLALGALLTITVGLALRPRRRPFPVPVLVPVTDPTRTTEPPT